jgi:hypothetical protein
MEESMCWEMDYKFLAEQKKAQEKRIQQQRRSDLIDQLLSDANQQNKEARVEGTPAKETAPAK